MVLSFLKEYASSHPIVSTVSFIIWHQVHAALAIVATTSWIMAAHRIQYVVLERLPSMVDALLPNLVALRIRSLSTTNASTFLITVKPSIIFISVSGVHQDIRWSLECVDIVWGLMPTSHVLHAVMECSWIARGSVSLSILIVHHIALRLEDALVASMVRLQSMETVVTSDMSSKMRVASSQATQEAQGEAYLCSLSMENIVRRSILKNRYAHHA